MGLISKYSLLQETGHALLALTAPSVFSARASFNWPRIHLILRDHRFRFSTWNSVTYKSMDGMGTMETEAVEFYQQGDFTSALEIFEKSFQAASSDALKDLYKFNIASCHGSQNDCTKALNYLTEIKAFAGDDVDSLHNKILCLNKLGRLDLVLPLLEIMGRSAKHGNEDLFVQLLLDCMDNLERHNLNRRQCEILETLMREHKSYIVSIHGESMWTQNMGHTLFLADTRFDDCVRLYETLLTDDNAGDDDDLRDLLRVHPMVLANLCVSYILSGRNRDAEELIKETEYAEESADQSSVIDASNEPSLGMSHLIHLNLAIGTLYCVKGNHEFGLSRIFKCLEPMDKNLSPQSWQQAKKCILSTLDKHCKQLICIKDELFDQMVSFLIQCETRGIHVAANGDRRRFAPSDGRNSVTYEARYLRAIILELIND